MKIRIPIKLSSVKFLIHKNLENIMNNGIYFLSFKSQDKDFGTGLLIVDNDKIYGGDSFYSYKGTLESNILIINLFKHTATSHLFFGSHDKIKLNLICHSELGGYLLTGNVENLQTVQLVVHAKFIGQLP